MTKKTRPGQKRQNKITATKLPSSFAEGLLAEGLELHRAGRLADAEKIYRELVALQPDQMAGLQMLAMIFLQRGNYVEALNQIDSALKSDHRNVLALNIRGATLKELKRFKEALASFDRALVVRPDYTEALSNRGVVLFELKRFEEALASYDRAIALRPDHADALANRGVVLFALQRFKEALASYDQALALRPAHVDALVNRGVVLFALQRFKEALASYDRALALQPDYAEALLNRGNTLVELKRFDEALGSYDRALTLRPSLAEAHSNRGLALHKLRRFEEALASYDRALTLRPNYAEALSNRGITLKELQRYEEALANCDHALALRPDYAEALLNRGVALFGLKRFEEALASYDRALEVRPDYAEAFLSRGIVLSELKRYEEALASYDRALVVRPDYAEAYNSKGNLLRELGQLAQAQSAYIEALRLNPSIAGVYLNLADSKTFSAEDPHLTAMKALATKTDGLSKTDRMRLDFALGKAYADLKQYHRSFEHLHAGNVAKRSTISYDEPSALAWFDRIEAVFTRELIEAKSVGGDLSPMPIFVIGMPRSGTTLVEQIIASHPSVCGAGELQALDDVVLAVSELDGNKIPYPEFVLAVDALDLSQIGARYIAIIREFALSLARTRSSGPMEGGIERVTDKMPSNYYFAGLIHLALPYAKIIHTIRDPIDTCMSCFSRLFGAEQSYAYELGELGRYYKRYEHLMAHWHGVLPPGRILDIRYEDVVADLEGQARRIISYCELPWDDRCLSFYKADRPVSTASATQVRQPIYKSAVGRWRDYEQYLGPLLTALDVALEKER